MAERLDLTTPEVTTLSDWRVIGLNLSTDTPSIKFTVRSNTGTVKHVRYLPVPGDPDSIARIRAGLRFINRGNFVGQGKSLEKWLLEKARDDDFLGPGTVTGSPD